MNLREKYEINKEYILSERLDKLIDFQENCDYREGVFDKVNGKLKIPTPPDAADLVRIHKLVRQRKSFTVLEFGSGYSTIIIADALQKNQRDWEGLPSKPEIRNRFMFQLFSVDASRNWINKTKSRMPAHLLHRVKFNYSRIKIGTFNGRLCSYYRNLPDIVPDFVYLDGPGSKDVKGKINGLSFLCDERTPIAADLILMESTFLPGIFILVDGRTNNARFLKENFKRNYDITWDKEGDITTFELIEERLGKYNLLGSDFFN